MAQTATAAAERELILCRIIDAPRELVFRMWTDPAHLAKWWGPRDFTNPVCEIDARPGGVLRIVMRAPDGTDYPMAGVFREIVAPERLVFTNCALDHDGNILLDGLTVVTFAEEGGKTKLTVQTHAVALVPAAARYLDGMKAGWEQTLDGLEEHALDTASRELTVTRVFDAPREVVFRAWTDPAGAAGLHDDFLRDGCASRRGLPRLHALARGHKALPARRLSRGGQARAAGLHLCLGRRGRQSRPRDGGHGQLCRDRQPDQADPAPGGVRDGRGA
jgi:uncharacterized protein YndB with AHSA1/START domain